MKFTMARDRVVATTLGHSIEFKKGVPTNVPPALYDIVQQHGAVPEEEIPESEETKTIVPTDPAERSGLIQAALEIVVTRNRKTDFTANNLPHTKALTAELGWSVDAAERDVEWAKFQAVQD